jgi:hypothetical protein
MNRTEALAASESFDVDERIGSIAYIGNIDDDECRRAMIRLLTDCNIAVCEAAGKYLVDRNDLQSALLLFAGIAVSSEQQGAWVLWQIRNAWTAGLFDLERFSAEITGDGDFLSRSGLHDVLRWLGLEP